MDVVNLAEKFSLFTDRWSPKIVGEVNDMHVKLVKLAGEFVWHQHEREDELFLVVAGRLRMQLRGGDREVGPGELIVVPKGTEHCPLALTDEVHVLLLEPKTTLNTGNVVNERTVAALDRLWAAPCPVLSSFRISARASWKPRSAMSSSRKATS